MAENEDYREGEEVDENYNPEDEVTGNWASVNLPEVPLVTGEEDDEVLAKFRAKLYRFTDKQWKERGIGELKISQNKNTKQVRVIMRREKIHKIIANHLILAEGPLCQLKKLQTSEKAWFWDSYDFSEDQSKFERLCAKFTSLEDYNKFKEAFEKAAGTNADLKEKNAKKENEEKKQE